MNAVVFLSNSLKPLFLDDRNAQTDGDLNSHSSSARGGKVLTSRNIDMGMLVVSEEGESSRLGLSAIAGCRHNLGSRVYTIVLLRVCVHV